MKPVKAWIVVLEDGSLCARSDGTLDVYHDRMSGMVMIQRLAKYKAKLIRVEIREIKKKGAK